MSRTFVIGLALAGLLGGCGESLGVSDENPLGEFEAIDEYLAGERKFQKKPDKIRDAECFLDRDFWEKLEPLKTFKYRDVGQGASAGDIFIKVALDETGKVRAIVGRFFSKRAIWTDAGGRAESFIGMMWKEISGGEATFSRENRPGGMVDEFLLAEFDTGSVAGKWEKEPTTSRTSDTNTLWDQVLIWRK